MFQNIVLFISTTLPFHSFRNFPLQKMNGRIRYLVAKPIPSLHVSAFAWYFRLETSAIVDCVSAEDV